ncbi:MAG: four helix bundle protein [Acidobacteria bacterium]|nr:four helix bundle protein [Acidobacteriota bacterium]
MLLATALLRLYRRTLAMNPAMAHAGLQMFRAGTAIGASLEEGQVANSRRDMAAKYAIALREAREATYWLRLLATEPSLTAEATTHAREAGEFVAMLTVSVRRLRDHPDG